MCSLGRRRCACYYYYVHRWRVPDASRHDDNVIASVTHTFTRKHGTRTSIMDTISVVHEERKRVVPILSIKPFASRTTIPTGHPFLRQPFPPPPRGGARTPQIRSKYLHRTFTLFPHDYRVLSSRILRAVD
uniref:Uncharacterized protein n=1 Tax=Sipha flava TaxID=143950 RepID=A0A2S2QZF6_9HEMI